MATMQALLIGNINSYHGGHALYIIKKYYGLSW